MSDCLLSLCIPTNGIIEWVVPVLDSIFDADCDLDDFEVIITDNGNNQDFQKVIDRYLKKYRNITYKKTDAIQFSNQIEAFKLAKGHLIKFVNHRMVLISGALRYLIEYAEKNIEEQPVTYFLNGAARTSEVITIYKTFDQYVRGLSYWSSWSAGTAMWKTELNQMMLDRDFNQLFPHTDILFFNKGASKYIINNKRLFEEIPADITKKGKYDLFKAFASDYLDIIAGLQKEGCITKKTFEYVKKKNYRFVCNLYFDYVVMQKPCSYDLSGYSLAIKKYYSDFSVKARIPLIIIYRLLKYLKEAKFVGGKNRFK